jgi:transaldolase
MRKLNIKLYVDGSSLQDLEKLNESINTSGFTYNPTLIRKLGAKDYINFCKEVVSIVKCKPVSLEVISDDFMEMQRQAELLASLGDNVYVKIPVTNTLGESSCKLIKKLTNDGIKLNVTAVFTVPQTIKIIKALKGDTKSIISVFAGRIYDTGVDASSIMMDVVSLCKPHKNIEVLWASPRQAYDVVLANNIGCDIITATPDILSKLSLFGKNLTDFSRETILMFFQDSKKSGFLL